MLNKQSKGLLTLIFYLPQFPLFKLHICVNMPCKSPDIKKSKIFKNQSWTSKTVLLQFLIYTVSGKRWGKSHLLRLISVFKKPRKMKKMWLLLTCCVIWGGGKLVTGVTHLRPYPREHDGLHRCLLFLHLNWPEYLFILFAVEST